MYDYKVMTRRLCRRKKTLFAAACCRQIWDLLDDKQRAAVSVIESGTERMLRNKRPRMTAAINQVWEEVKANHDIVVAYYDKTYGKKTEYHVSVAVRQAFYSLKHVAGVTETAENCTLAVWQADYDKRYDVSSRPKVKHRMYMRHAEIRDDLLDLSKRKPFGPDVCNDPRGSIAAMAREIYDTGRFSELPILGDAISDASPHLTEVIDHLHRKEHYRGCWALDWILGHTKN